MAVYSCPGIYIIPAVIKIRKRHYLVFIARICSIINIRILHFLSFFFKKIVCYYWLCAIDGGCCFVQRFEAGKRCKTYVFSCLFQHDCFCWDSNYVMANLPHYSISSSIHYPSCWNVFRNSDGCLKRRIRNDETGTT